MSAIDITVGTSDMGQDADQAAEVYAIAFAAYLRTQLPGATVKLGSTNHAEGIEPAEIQAHWTAFLLTPEAISMGEDD